MPKRIFNAISLFLITGSIFYSAISCTQTRDKREPDKAKLSTELKNLITKWDANSDWENQIGNNSLELVFTSEIQKFLGEDKRPLLAFLELKDIVRQSDGSLIAWFLSTDLLDEPRILFALRINDGHYKYLLSQDIMALRGVTMQKFALVIRAHEVQPPFQYFINNTSDKENELYSSFLRTESLPLILGDCLEVIFLGLLDRHDLSL